MKTEVAGLVCSQCGREAPSGDEELAAWRHGELALTAGLDEIAVALLLCPDCVAEDHAGAYEEGGGA